MEELDIKELFSYYLKKLPIIILITILAILLGFLYIEHYQVPMYYGKTTIILIQNNENTTSNNLNETENQLNINEKLVATYSEIIKSRRVLNQVLDNLNLETSISSLENKIDVDSVSDTAIIEITVSDKNNKRAAMIANELATVFKKEVINLYNLENVSIIDEAIVEEEPYNINKVKQMVIYTGVGIIGSCLLIFIAYYFDNSIKNKKEIETRFDIPVLGEIPSATKLIKKEINMESSLEKKNKVTQPKKASTSKTTKPQKSKTTSNKNQIKSTSKTSSKKTTKKATSKSKKEGDKE